MNRLDYYRAILFTVILTTVFLTGFYAFNQDNPNEHPITPKSNFEVVDTYKECEIIQYTNPQLANYHYLLYCPQK